jgi:hypothetical protein
LGEALLPSGALNSFGRPCEFEATELLETRPEGADVPFPRVSDSPSGRFRYGYIGLSDRRMVPLLRPGSSVLIDTSLRRIEVAEWSNEYDRPCSPTLYRAALRKSGKSPKKPKSLEESLAWLLT